MRAVERKYFSAIKRKASELFVTRCEFNHITLSDRPWSLAWGFPSLDNAERFEDYLNDLSVERKLIKYNQADGKAAVRFRVPVSCLNDA